jgi:hypothetical protein
MISASRSIAFFVFAVIALAFDALAAFLVLCLAFTS